MFRKNIRRLPIGKQINDESIQTDAAVASCTCIRHSISNIHILTLFIALCLITPSFLVSSHVQGAGGSGGEIFENEQSDAVRDRKTAMKMWDLSVKACGLTTADLPKAKVVTTH